MAEENPRGIVSNAISQLLAYMDKPWKVGAVVILLLSTGIGWLVWSEKPLLREWLAHKPPILKDAGLVRPLLGELMIQTSADFVSLWSVRLGPPNIQRMVLTKWVGGEWDFKPTTLPVIIWSSDSERILKIFNGQSVCEEPTGDSVLIQRMASDGMAWICIIPVMPTSRKIIGVLYIGWKVKPNQALENAFINFTTDYMDKFVNHGGL